MVWSAIAGGIAEVASTAMANKANRDEAEKDRRWQEQQSATAWERSRQAATTQFDRMKSMSDTAHQREVADLKAAGLNPILSAGGKGASTPQPSMAQPQTGKGAMAKMEKAQLTQAVSTAAATAMEVKRRKKMLPVEYAKTEAEARVADEQSIYWRQKMWEAEQNTAGIELDNLRKESELIRHKLLGNVYKGDIGSFLAYAEAVSKALGADVGDLINMIPLNALSKAFGKNAKTITEKFGKKGWESTTIRSTTK
jgi:hypothetical protein